MDGPPPRERARWGDTRDRRREKGVLSSGRGPSASLDAAADEADARGCQGGPTCTRRSSRWAAPSSVGRRCTADVQSHAARGPRCQCLR
jgi:hypothetical protein